MEIWDQGHKRASRVNNIFGIKLKAKVQEVDLILNIMKKQENYTKKKFLKNSMISLILMNLLRTMIQQETIQKDQT